MFAGDDAGFAFAGEALPEFGAEVLPEVAGEAGARFAELPVVGALPVVAALFGVVVGVFDGAASPFVPAGFDVGAALFDAEEVAASGPVVGVFFGGMTGCEPAFGGASLVAEAFDASTGVTEAVLVAAASVVLGEASGVGSEVFGPGLLSLFAASVVFAAGRTPPAVSPAPCSPFGALFGSGLFCGFVSDLAGDFASGFFAAGAESSADGPTRTLD